MVDNKRRDDEGFSGITRCLVLRQRLYMGAAGYFDYTQADIPVISKNSQAVLGDWYWKTTIDKQDVHVFTEYP